MKKYLGEQGLTIVELILSIALLGIVTLMVFSLSSYGLNSFEKTKSQSHVQQEVRMLEEIIKKQLRNAMEISTESLPNSSQLFMTNDRFYYGENRWITVEYVEKITIMSSQAGEILIFEITTKDSIYDMTSQILLNNTIFDYGDNKLQLEKQQNKLYYR